MTTVYVYFCICLLSLYALGVVRTTVQVFVGRASFERKCQMSEHMDELGHILSLVISYQGSSVVVPVCDMDRQGFQQLFGSCSGFFSF